MRRMSLILFACAMLAACQAPGAGRVAAVPGEHHLEVGDFITLPDHSTLAYVRVVADSRCPPDVQCVWAGDAAIELQWTGNAGDARTVTLHSNPQAGENAATLGGRKVSFAALARGTPRASLRIDRAD